jgi:tetratricopeptide (TPR) repeat protein
MVRNRTVERLSIRRFDRGGVNRMIEALAGRTPPEQVIDAIFRETEGNPFFIDEVFRHLVEDGKLFDANGAFRSDLQVDELDVPESIRLVVGRRLERLGHDAQRALAAGAVVGRGFPFSMLEEISDLGPGRLLDIVEEAEAARVIVPELLDGEVHYSFAHELIRQTLLASLSVLRRQRLHLAVANAMERLHRASGKGRPSEIAAHLLQAGAAAEADRTLGYLEQAAEQAMDAAAFEEALRAIDDALSIVGDGDPLRRARLRERQGHALRAFGRFDDSLSIWSEVVDVYSEHGEVQAAGDLCWLMGYQLVWLNRFTDAFATYTRGLTIVGDDQVPAKAALIASTGLLTGFAGLYDDGTAQLAEAEQIAQTFDDDRSLARVNWGRSLVNWSFGRLADAIDAGRHAVAAARRTNDAFLLADALSWLSFPLGSTASFADGTAAAREAYEISVKAGHIAGEVLARRGLLLNGVPAQADLEDLERGVRKDLELCLSIQSPWSSQSYAWISNVLTLRGLVEEALELADASIRTEPTSAWSGVGWTSRLANRLYAGDADQAQAMVREKLDVLRTVADPMPMGQVAMVSMASEACAIFGLGEWAGEFYPTVVQQAERVPMRPFDWALMQRVAGMLAASVGDWTRAVEHFETALAQAEKFPNALDEPQVQLFYGKALLDRGGADEILRGRELVSAAVRGFGRLGIPLRMQFAEQVLKSGPG